MKSSISFSKKMLFSHSVSSASIKSVCRRISKFYNMASRCFALASGKFLQHATRRLLQLSEARQISLKFLVQGLRLDRSQFRPQDHVSQLHWMRQQRVFLQFFQGLLGVVVVHKFSSNVDQNDCTR